MAELNDFSGGKTDNYIGGPINMGEVVDNLVVNEYNDLIQRAGLDQYREFVEQIPAGTQRIDAVYFFDGALFVKSGTRLYFAEAGNPTWNILDAHDGHAFSDSEVGSRCSFSEWRGHLLMTSTPTGNLKGGFKTIKVFRDTNGDWTLLRAGVPRILGEVTFPP